MQSSLWTTNLFKTDRYNSSEKLYCLIYANWKNKICNTKATHAYWVNKSKKYTKCTLTT